MDGRHGGSGGGGGGALILYSVGNMVVTGVVNATGGAGGMADVNGTNTDPDTDRGGGGGGGSGGAIILQSIDVTTTAGTVESLGGAGGVGDASPSQDGGSGGDGRVRVDGLRTGTTTKWN